LSYLIGTDILNFINQNESIETTNLETSLSTPFLKDIAKTDDFFLKYITDTNTETMPNHSALIASIPSKHGGVGYRNPSRAALGAFTIPIARTIDYAIRGIKLRESRATIPNDHKYLFQNLIESTSGNPWKMISEIAPRILATFPILPNATNNTNNHETSIYAKLSTRQAQRHLCRALTSEAMIKETPNIEPCIRKFLPSLLSPLTSLALHNLPRSEPSNRIANAQFTLLLQPKLRLPIINSVTNCICGSRFDKYGDHAFGCKRTSKTTMHDSITKTLTTTLRPLL
jgi:hypothetical protein